MSNTVKVKTDGGETEVYVHEVCRLFDEYIEQLDNPEDIYKPTGFAGACKHVYMQLFKPREPQLYNKGTTVNTDDVKVLDALWDLFCTLCYKYGTKPTIQRFGLMIGITPETFSTWNKREYRANTPHSESYRKWKAECESALVDSVAATGNVGGIFLLKSCYQYRESAPLTPEEMLPEVPRDTPEQIRERHRHATLPEMPDI